MKRIINILLLFLLVQTFTFAQGVGVDSMLVESVSVDSVADNTIKDTIVLEYSQGYVRFETIRREGDKYFAVTSDNKDVEITSMINGKTRALVQDGDGHELVIDKDGNVMGVEEYKKCGGSSKLLSEHNAYRDSTMATSGNVKFSKVKDENYGFDEWRGAEYDKDVYDNFNGYRPTYIGAQKQSNIKVAASQTKGIRFITERGVPIIANAADNTLNLTIGTAGKQTVYAYRDSTLVGKLCIQAYDVKEVKVHVVRVNNGKQLELNKIADEVNRIYGSAVVHYTFDELAPITIEYANGKHFVHGGKGTFQNYNADQKAAIKALPETADPNDYYLFFTDCYNRLDTAGNVSPEAVNGYMPVGRHYGFIYNEYTNARTIAHELGHGTNSLHHTFSQESETFRTTEKTDNIMDYNAGEYLNHRQWQWAHEKHRNVLGFLDDEGESEAKYWIADDYLQNKKVEIAYWKWQNDGAPRLTIEEIDKIYFSQVPMNKYQKDLFLGIAGDVANLNSRDKESAEMFRLLVEEGNIEEETLTTLIKERHELAEYYRTIVPLLATGDILTKYCVILSVFSTPNTLPSMGKIGTHIAKLTGAKANSLASKVSITYAELHPGKWLKQIGRYFVQGSIADATIQTVVNIATEENLKGAIGEIDFADVALTGAINVVTGGTASLRKLFGIGSKVAIVKGTTVVTLELTTAAVDWKPFNDSKEFASLFGGDKDALNFFCDFALGMSGNILPDEFIGILKKWAKADFDVRWYSTLTKSEKEQVRKIYDIVHSPEFSIAIETNADLVKTFIQNVFNQNNTFIKTIDVKEYEFLPNEYQMPKDNTNVVIPITIYDYQ